MAARPMWVTLLLFVPKWHALQTNVGLIAGLAPLSTSGVAPVDCMDLNE